MSGVPLVRDVMATSLVTLRPEQAIRDAIAALLKAKISGAPVVDAAGALVGVLSEKDCLRVFASSAYFQSGEGTVGDYMSRTIRSVAPDDDVFKVADLFLTNHFRRLPVLEGGKLVGQVSRRDILRASMAMLEAPKPWTDSRFIPADVQTLLNDKPPPKA